MKNLALLVTLFLLVGCATYKAVAPTQMDVERVSVKYPNLTLAELNQGKQLFETHCGNCHGLKNPASRSEEKWQKIVPRMAEKVNKKGEVLDARGQELILQFVVTMGTKPE